VNVFFYGDSIALRYDRIKSTSFSARSSVARIDYPQVSLFLFSFFYNYDARLRDSSPSAAPQLPFRRLKSARCICRFGHMGHAYTLGSAFGCPGLIRYRVNERTVSTVCPSACRLRFANLVSLRKESFARTPRDS